MNFTHTIKRMILLLCCAVWIVPIAGCGGKDSSSNYYSVPKDGADVVSGVAADPITLSFGATRSDYIMDPYTLENIRIEGDNLYLQVTYNGGCEEHIFELVALNDFLAAQPVQADLLLTHDANNDNCKSPVREELQFSLLSIKDEYKVVFKTDTGSLTLRVQDPANADNYRTLVYSF